MNNNVVDFRVMRRLCHRQWNWQSVNGEPHSWDPRQRTTWSRLVTPDFNSVYAVKVQRSLAPLSRFRGSHILTAHEQECCRFQSYANSVRSPIYKRNLHCVNHIPGIHDNGPRDHELWRRTLTAYYGVYVAITGSAWLLHPARTWQPSGVRHITVVLVLHIGS